MEELLKKMGFKNITGPLWDHPEIGIITISETDSPATLAWAIYQRGYSKRAENIRDVLGIKQD